MPVTVSCDRGLSMLICVKSTLHNAIFHTISDDFLNIRVLSSLGTIFPKAKVGGKANSLCQKVDTCLAGYNTCTCISDDVLHDFIKLTKVNTERRSNAA